MRLKFSYTADDFRALHRARATSRYITSSPHDRWVVWAGSVLGPIGACLAVRLWWIAHPRLTPNLAIAAVGVGAYVGFTLIAPVVKLRASQKLTRLVREMTPVVLDVEEVGVIRTFSCGRHHYRWDSFDKFLGTKAHCFIRYTDQANKWMVIPLRGLTNEGDGPALRELLVRQVQPATHAFPVLSISAPSA